MQLVLDTHGLVVKKRNGCFQIVHDDKQTLINPARVTSIAVTSQCMLSSSAIRLAIAHEVPIYFMNSFGVVEGRLWSASFGHQASIRRKQSVLLRHTEATAWVLRLFVFKTQGQLSNLLYLKDRRRGKNDLMETATKAFTDGLTGMQALQNQLLPDCRDALMGHEGYMARAYWQTVSAWLPDEWQFDTRSRQPAQDAFNAGLNYLYGMLYGTVETALFSAGLDPYMGMLHSDQYNRPTLSYDLIEPFRPWADRLLLEGVLTDEVRPSFFDTTQTGVILNKAGKAYFIPQMNRWLLEQGVFDGKRARRRTHIYRLAGTLCDTLRQLDI